ncbi:hypothetical protein HaLaN_32170 [Haematococcus lacustris]|uniref:Uncharacterized protein n=1 Tax=Haematococcus lacustris TaxID=44745 RepID=A0A6A0AIX6_HAELA|nr:hypothetical protein HaLaN_32170 [Haematococcus lacustris]
MQGRSTEPQDLPGAPFSHTVSRGTRRTISPYLSSKRRQHESKMTWACEEQLRLTCDSMRTSMAFSGACPISLAA